MRPSDADTVLVRYGEIGTKSEQVRGWMESILVDNLTSRLQSHGVDATIDRRYRSRPIVRTTSADVEDATEAAATTVGVVSASAAQTVEPTESAISDTMAEIAVDHYDGGSFAVRARCAGDDHPFTSDELETTCGSKIWETIETERNFEPVVDLDSPDWTVFVECRPGEAFLFLRKREGPGGLPLGSQEPLVALISGGIDSPVAAYEVMRRGSPIVPLYVDLGRFGGVDHRGRAIDTVETLGTAVPESSFQLRIVPGETAVETLLNRVGRGRMLIWRRFMFRVAELIAEREDACGIVTGEAIGQKSSQTTQNLAVTSAATSVPIHRPLLTADKNDITERAKDIGTFTDSSIPVGCKQLVPEQVETRGSLDEIEQIEPDIIAALARDAVEQLEIVDPA